MTTMSYVSSSTSSSSVSDSKETVSVSSVVAGASTLENIGFSLTNDATNETKNADIIDVLIDRLEGKIQYDAP
jgi:hypothetical protein